MLSFPIKKLVRLSLSNLYDMVMELVANKKVTLDSSVKELLQVILTEQATLGD